MRTSIGLPWVYQWPQMTLVIVLTVIASVWTADTQEIGFKIQATGNTDKKTKIQWEDNTMWCRYVNDIEISCFGCLILIWPCRCLVFLQCAQFFTKLVHLSTYFLPFSKSWWDVAIVLSFLSLGLAFSLTIQWMSTRLAWCSWWHGRLCSRC
jgi:hypothetical protein